MQYGLAVYHGLQTPRYRRKPVVNDRTRSCGVGTGVVLAGAGVVWEILPTV
jgi:hypothetical protein